MTPRFLLRYHRSLFLVWISLAVLGCASRKDTVLPQDGPTMKTIYEQHLTQMSADDPRRRLRRQPLPAAGAQHYRGFVREAANEIDTVFPRLPNPTLVMYIYPHLSRGERTPVPGYVTSFPLYTTVEYALPGEAMDRVAPDREPRAQEATR
jgi:conjugative transfer region lipoprotein (TIGR03751 family)